MKKLMIVFICCLLVGCHETTVVTSSKDDREDWIGIYKKGNIIVTILDSFDNKHKDVLEFEIEKGKNGFGDRAYICKDNRHQAIFKNQQYKIYFTLKDNQIIIKETDGLSYLHISLNGHYQKQ